MNCEEAIRLIHISLDETLSRGDEAKLTEHLRVCEKCRVELRKGGHLEEVLRTIPEPVVSRARLKETVRSISSEFCARTSHAGARHRAWPWAAVAAAVIIAALTGFLAGHYWVTPAEEAGAPQALEPTARGTGAGPTQKDVPQGTGTGEEKPAPRQRGMLVEKLVQADLALAEAQTPGHKAAIFCTMSDDVLSELQESLGSRDAEVTCTLAQAYTRLVRDGILPDMKLTSPDKEREIVSRVIDSLNGNCKVLGLLVAGAGGRERVLLTEALSVSVECLNAAEEMVGF